MTQLFPKPILDLPEADIQIKGIKAFLSQGLNHQIIFMEFSEDVEIFEHFHESQWGIVLEGKIDLKIDGVKNTFFNGISEFSHLEIIYYFDKVEPKDIVFSGHPRENSNYPHVGIFCMRKKDRPNPIGLSTVELLEHNGRTIKVKYLDAIEGTPVLDIKAVFKEFQPKGEIRQPNWVSDLMKDYWK